MDLTKLTKEQLSQLCVDSGLEPKGSKTALIARLERLPGLELREVEAAVERMEAED